MNNGEIKQENKTPLLGLVFDEAPVAQSLINKVLLMNTPQQVTERYTNNLIRNGQNDQFVLSYSRSQRNYAPDRSFLGYMFEARVLPQDSNVSSEDPSFGATPSQAVKNALEKYGVTFR